MEEFDLIFSVLNNKDSNYNLSTINLPSLNECKLKSLPVKKFETITIDEKTIKKIKKGENSNKIDIYYQNDSTNPSSRNISRETKMQIEQRSDINFHKKVEEQKCIKKKSDNQQLLRQNNSKQIDIKCESEKMSLIMPFINNVDVRYLDFRPLINLEIKKEKIDLGYYYKIGGNDCPLVRYLLEDNGFTDVSNFTNTIFIREWTILWSSCSIKPQTMMNLNKYQKVNHFPRSQELTRKDLLYMNLSKLKAENNKSFDFIPESFIMPKESKFLLEEMEKDPKVLWIVKPFSSSQGRGIFIVTEFKQIPSGKDFIVSKYISNPFLINGFKFDMRIYVLMTSIVPLRIYVYEDGFARFATEKYYVGQPFTGDKFMHLTNYAVNKQNKNFIHNIEADKDYEGSKWSLKALKNYFISIGKDWLPIQKKINDLIIKTVISAEHNMARAFLKNIKYKNCFELFGFDVLLDTNLHPWLMEVNFSPSLHIDSPLDLKIKGELISECLDIVRILPIHMREKENKFLSNSDFERMVLKEHVDNPLIKDIKFTKEIKENLWDFEEEHKRCKRFRILFPSEDSIIYRKYFVDEKAINFIQILKILYDNKKKITSKLVNK